MAQAKLENGVTLEYEVHGDRSRPVIFVILGITDNITDWPPGMFEPLVEAGYCVVCHELRDSGWSTKFEDFGIPNLGAAAEQLASGVLPEAPYTVWDVADDALLLMRYLDIRSACVVGYSYGSMVAQLLALRAIERLDGLVCLQGSNYNPSLPARSKAVQEAMYAATVEYPSVAEKINAVKELRLATNGSIHALDDDEASASARTSVERMYYPQGTARIVLSRFATVPFFEQTSEIICPTLILQADEDPIFSFEHGEDMASRIPNAKLVKLKGAGHNHPLSLQPIIATEIGRFARSVFQD